MNRLIPTIAFFGIAALVAGNAVAVTTPADRYTGIDCTPVVGTWIPTGGNNLRSSSSNSEAICPLRGTRDYDEIDVFLKDDSTAPSCVVFTSMFNNFNGGTEAITFFSHNSRTNIGVNNSNVWKVTFGYGSGWLDVSQKSSVYCSGLPSGAHMMGIEVDYH